MPGAAPARRAVCTRCLRPHTTCLCQWIAPTTHTVDVVVLQHPLEVHNAKGSARLLHLSLPNSRLLVGEVFDPQVLHDGQPPPPDAAARCHRQAVLLYPQPRGSAAPGTPTPSALTPDLLHDPAQLRLVVLDGTWRKSRKLLALNPWLQALPRLALRDPPPSRYLIRKAHRPDELSTLEAVCAALSQLEGAAVQVQPLLEAFDGFVAQQNHYAPVRRNAADGRESQAPEAPGAAATPRRSSRSAIFSPSLTAPAGCQAGLNVVRPLGNSITTVEPSKKRPISAPCASSTGSVA